MSNEWGLLDVGVAFIQRVKALRAQTPNDPDCTLEAALHEMLGHMKARFENWRR